MFNYKSEKGITLAVLITTVIILLILSTIAIYSVKSSKSVAPYNKMAADIDLLHDKLLDYYNKNGVIPKKDNTQTLIGNDNYYEIDLGKLENITLNYGLKQSSNDDVYLVDNKLNVYYKEGVELDGQYYHVKNDTQNSNDNNSTDWVLVNLVKNGVLEDGKDIKDETLNKINNLARRFTSYSANGQTYNLSKEDVIKFITVLYNDDEEFILYRYGPIFWSTHTYGEGEESYNRRAAIINYLNNQEEITGMLRGDMDENGKIDSLDLKYLQEYNFYVFDGYSSIPNQEEYDSDFRYYYLTIIGDADNSYYTDLNDIVYIDYYLSGVLDSTMIEEMTAKYYIDSDDTYWMEEGLMEY